MADPVRQVFSVTLHLNLFICEIVGFIQFERCHSEQNDQRDHRLWFPLAICVGLGDMKEESWFWLVLLHIKRSLKLSNNYLDMLLPQVAEHVYSGAAGMVQGFSWQQS